MWSNLRMEPAAKAWCAGLSWDGSSGGTAWPPADKGWDHQCHPFTLGHQSTPEWSRVHQSSWNSIGWDCWDAPCRDCTLIILWAPSSPGYSMILKKDLLMDVLKPRNGTERVRLSPVPQHRESCPSASTFHPAHFLTSRAAEQHSSKASPPKFVTFCLITVKQQHAHSITGKMRVGCFI